MIIFQELHIDNYFIGLSSFFQCMSGGLAENECLPRLLMSGLLLKDLSSFVLLPAESWII